MKGDAITLKELKNALGEWVSRAAKGNIIKVTRYNKPYIQITGDTNGSSLWIGRFAGKKNLLPGAPLSTKIHVKSVLDQDRGEST